MRYSQSALVTLEITLKLLRKEEPRSERYQQIQEEPADSISLMLMQPRCRVAMDDERLGGRNRRPLSLDTVPALGSDWAGAYLG